MRLSTNGDGSSMGGTAFGSATNVLYGVFVTLIAINMEVLPVKKAIGSGPQSVLQPTALHHEANIFTVYLRISQSI